MKCIFCKNSSAAHYSVEHIIPESLGNTEHVLPTGIICDVYNNYFARKIEQPLLESGLFRLLRHNRQLANKRGKIPHPPEDSTDLPKLRIMSRFVGKIGLAVLAARMRGESGWNKEIVNKTAADFKGLVSVSGRNAVQRRGGESLWR